MATGCAETRTRPTGATPYPHSLVKAVCKVVAQPGHPGLAGPEINRILVGIGVTTRPTGLGKEDGLCMVLFIAQLKDPSRIIAFIDRVMDRGRRVHTPAQFSELHRQLVRVLRDYGLTVDAMGQLAAA